MNALRQFVRQLTLQQLTIIALILCLPAFFLHLGAVAFIGDEAIRSLVALEMKLSGNFLVPTLNGEYYYNKPPLYNWIIYGMSTLFGHFGEWPARATTIIFLGLFGFSVYYFTKKHVDKLTAVTLALMLLTSGRILFWDSMLGLIDICFSFIVFTNFMFLYHFGKKERYWHLFIMSYVLFAIAFLLKGLPAVVFQGISVITALILHGNFRKKFLSVEHFIGGAIGLGILLAYYIPFADQVSIDKVFSVLFDQSMQRTATHHGIMKTVLHVFTFPFEQVYHFLPWSLLVLVFLHPSVRKRINEDSFLRFNFWMLVANLPVYWLSVQVYPRYLLMFVPLFNILSYSIAMQMMNEKKSLWKILRYTFIFLFGLLTIAVVLMPIDARAREMDGIWWIWIAGALAMSFIFSGVFYDERRMILWLCIGLLVTRSIFNFAVLPDRALTFHENKSREDCKRLAEKFSDRPWFIYGETETHQVARFYTASFKDQIIRKTSSVTNTSAYYLVNTRWHGLLEGEILDTLLLEGGHKIHLMDLKPVQKRLWVFDVID